MKTANAQSSFKYLANIPIDTHYLCSWPECCTGINSSWEYIKEKVCFSDLSPEEPTDHQKPHGRHPAAGHPDSNPGPGGFQGYDEGRNNGNQDKEGCHDAE